MGDYLEIDSELEFSGVIPAKWTLKEAKDIEQKVLVQQENAAVLAAIIAIDEVKGDAFDHRDAQFQDLSQLEVKVDLALSLLTSLFHHFVPLPARVPIKLTSGRLFLSFDKKMTAGEVLEVTLYLSDKYPQPIILKGEVLPDKSLQKQELVCVQLSDLSESEKDGIEKFIFRHHRRMIAKERENQRHH